MDSSCFQFNSIGWIVGAILFAVCYFPVGLIIAAIIVVSMYRKMHNDMENNTLWGLAYCCNV